jgi:hypothetical protein
MRIWFPLLAAPTLALTDQSIALAMTGWACANQQAFAMHGVHALFLVATVAATVAAWGLWRATSRAKPDEPIARRHFLAGVATASSALSTLVIAAMWVPNWILSPCLA